METLQEPPTVPNAGSISEYDAQYGVKIPMRDGIELNATVYRKNGQTEPVSTIFTMTPYISDGLHPRAEYFSKEGFVFIIVDVRGRGNSGGEYDPFFHDAKDGADIVKWIREQSFCNGKVAMWGGSYVGFNQWSTIKEHPEGLVTIIPVASVYPAHDFPYGKNVMYPYVIQWLLYTGLQTRNDNLAFSSEYISKKFYDAHQSFLPYEKLDEFVGFPCKPFQKWIKHLPNTEFWKSMVPNAEQYAKIDVPILTITGHYDGDQPGAMRYYGEHMRYGSEKSKKDHYLIIGPWDHGGTRTPVLESMGLKYGEKSLIDMNELHRDWYRWAMDGGEKPAFLKKRVAYFVAGPEDWKYADTLEEVTMEHRKLFLTSRPGQDLTAFDSGRLVPELSDDPSPDAWTYDPLDTRYAEFEKDIKPQDNLTQYEALSPFMAGLVFHSEPLEEETEFTGFFRATLSIEMDVPDTDIEVLVFEIQSNGTSIALTRDMLRARYRTSIDDERLVEPGKIETYEFKSFMFNSRVLQAGSRIRVVVQSPLSIRRGKNYNSGGFVPSETAKDARTAHLKLYHNNEHPSFIEIPIGKKN